MKRLSYKKQIDKIMQDFDWERLANSMQAMKWEWGRSHGVPDIKHLQECARELLDGVKGRNNHTYSTGGFQASCNDGYLTLQFVIGEAVGYEII